MAIFSEKFSPIFVMNSYLKYPFSSKNVLFVENIPIFIENIHFFENSRILISLTSFFVILTGSCVIFGPCESPYLFGHTLPLNRRSNKVILVARLDLESLLDDVELYSRALRSA